MKKQIRKSVYPFEATTEMTAELRGHKFMLEGSISPNELAELRAAEKIYLDYASTATPEVAAQIIACIEQLRAISTGNATLNAELALGETPTIRPSIAEMLDKQQLIADMLQAETVEEKIETLELYSGLNFGLGKHLSMLKGLFEQGKNDEAMAIIRKVIAA